MFSAHMLRMLRPAGVLKTFTSPSGSPFDAALNVCFLTSRRSLTSDAFRRSLLKHKHKVQLCRPSVRFSTSEANSEDGKLIYTGSLARAVRGVKLFSYSTSGASLLIMPQILLQTGLGVQSFAVQAVFCGVVGFFTFLTPAILHYVTKGYVIRLYHHADRDAYTAVTYSVFLTEKMNKFHQRQVTVPAVSKMFTSFYADKTGLLVNPDLFSLPHDYNHLMGYDKPFTFDMGDKNAAEKH